ncbi:MAG: hypothetical protein JKY94_10475 [Rhodobacteraceae bacterium]|nr:hypothetical protein [Paracoccaceae bacterium]
MRISAVFLALALPCSALAQEPMSVIEWLSQDRPVGLTGRVLLEPPVTGSARHSVIAVTPLEMQAQPVGLVPGSATGLPADMWEASDADTLARLIAQVQVLDTPAMQTLLYTLLLSETRPPAGKKAAETMLLARIDRLLELGATDPAQALVQHAGATETQARFARWFDATLLTGDEDRSCAALTATPHLAPDYAARIFCGARGGDWATAALLLEAAHALELLPHDTLALLDRFLSPEMFEGAPHLPTPAQPNPLSFRMFEAIGERFPTASLPRAFATADLRDVAGWKAQLEAAERLARIGALSPNRLLGIYSERLPAASGGIWDRVSALQRFETALNSGSADAVTKTLPIVWAAMQDVQLEVPFAVLFSERLAALDIDDPATAALAYKIRLLSSSYELAAQNPPLGAANARFLAALAQGEPSRVPASTPVAQAITDGFVNGAALPTNLQHGLNNGQLGLVILKAIGLFDSGVNGDLGDLTEALVTLRSVGLEDTARRAALQLMLLKRS